MIVHLIIPRDGLQENILNIQKVVDIIKAKGHSLANEWIEDAYKRTSGGEEVSDQDWQKIIEENLAAIAKSDVIIADVSYDSTAMGYQIATALHQKKPTLLILQDGKRVPAFTWNIPSSFLKKEAYTSDNIADKIAPFLQDNDIGTKDMRFNFFIDRGIYNYLRWAALKTGKTKAEILRELVNREINNKEY